MNSWTDRATGKSWDGGESGLFETGSGCWPRPTGRQQIHCILGLMQYMQSASIGFVPQTAVCRTDPG